MISFDAQGFKSQIEHLKKIHMFKFQNVYITKMHIIYLTNNNLISLYPSSQEVHITHSANNNLTSSHIQYKLNIFAAKTSKTSRSQYE